MRIALRPAGKKVQTASQVDRRLTKHRRHGGRVLDDVLELGRSLRAGAVVGRVLDDSLVGEAPQHARGRRWGHAKPLRDG